MRICSAVLFASIVSAGLARADDAADAQAIVSKAIKATGVKETGKPLAMTWKDKGTFSGGGFKMDYTADWAFQGPDKYRFVVNGDFGGMKVEFTVVVNGDKAWQSGFGMTEEIKGEKLQYTLTEVYELNVISLVSLVGDKAFKLSTDGEKKVGGKPAKVVKVARDKQPTITLYFDKESGLLVKAELMVKDEFQMWKEVPNETYFEDYKDVKGQKMFTKMKVVRDGKTMIEAEMYDQKSHDKLDAKLFDKLEPKK